MLKNKLWIGTILSIILLIFTIPGFTAYYKYTQESGANFYVGTADKSDALEDTNEMRQIIDDLGALLVHDKRNDLYPKDETTGGTLQIPEAGLKFSNDPANNDLAAYIAGEMAWQTKAELGLDLTLYYLKSEINTQAKVEAIWGVSLVNDSDLDLYYLKTAIDSQAEVETIWGVSLVNDGDLDLYYLKTAIDTLGEVETIYSANIIDDTELATALGDYYLKTSIDTLGEVETIYSANIVDTTEMATALTDYYLKTAIDTQGEIETIWGVALLNDITGEDFADLADIPAHPAAATKVLETTIDGYAWINTPSGGGGASQLSDLSDVGSTTPTNKYVLVADGDSWESRALIEADISDLGTYKGGNYYSAVASDHTYSDNADTDSQPVGENVVFGQLLYYDWTDVEWKLAKADAFGTAKATRIALETKGNGETCLMLVKGYIRDDSAFDFGAARVFLNDDTAGTCDDTAPAESGDQIFVVGEAKSADILFFDPGKDVGEI